VQIPQQAGSLWNSLRRTEAATGNPFVPSNILATLYHVLGVDLTKTLLDHAGRPQFLLDEREPLRQLL
jgi:hypothetical protein